MAGGGGSSWQGRRPCHHLCPLVKQEIVGSGTFKQHAHACTHSHVLLLPVALIQVPSLLCYSPDRSALWGRRVFSGEIGKAGWLVRESDPSEGVKGENLEVERGGRGNERRAPLKDGMKRGEEISTSSWN